MKTILTILLSLLTILCYSQSTRRIDILFEFKLGMTIQEIKQVVDTSLLEEVGVEDCGSLDYFMLGSDLDGRIKKQF